MPYDEFEAEQKVRSLIIAIRDFVQNQKDSGSLQQSEELIRKWRVIDFAYNENGISSFAQMGEVFKENTWSIAVLTISFRATLLPQYGPVFQFLVDLQSQKIQPPVYLPRFCNKVVTKFLNEDHVPDSDIDNFVTAFLLDISGRPIRIKIRVGLTGIVIEPDEIQIDGSTRLIKPKKEDFEWEENIFHVLQRHVHPHPTAFLEIFPEIDNQDQIMTSIERSITYLRLYHSGMIRFTEYRLTSSSVFYDSTGIVESSDNTEIHEKYLLKNEDSQNFIGFWREISTIIPDSLFRNDTFDFRTIAYNRYLDAIKYDHLPERRISTAIMGLEGIFLKSGGENAELQFRLSLRIANLLKNMDYDPLSVKQVIRDAYEIRSIFLHGDALTPEKKVKMAEKYGDNFHNLLFLTLDILRVSLIISISLQIKKDTFIKYIDDSLWNSNLSDELLRQIEQGKSIVILTKLEN